MEWFCCLLKKSGQRIGKINTFHISLEINTIKYYGTFEMLSEENNFCGINRACLKGSAEIKDFHPSAIKYDRKQTPQVLGIFACEGSFQTVLKLIIYFQICLRYFMKAVGNRAARFQPITALDYLKIDCQFLFLTAVI